MTIPEDVISDLESQGRDAIVAKDWEACRRISDRFFEIDPDCDIGYAYYLEGCTCMAEGDYMGVAAAWMCALDHMEDMGEIETVCGSIADLCADFAPTWVPPALRASTAVMSISRSSSDILGRSPVWLAHDIIGRMTANVSAGGPTGYTRDSAVSLVAAVMVFCTDLRDSIAVIEEMYRLLRAVDERDGTSDTCGGEDFEMYRYILDEWHQATEGMTDDQIGEIAEYWSTRPQKFKRILAELIEVFVSSDFLSRGCSPDDGQKRVRIFILKWLRIRK